jgi:hypothetical protein
VLVGTLKVWVIHVTPKIKFLAVSLVNITMKHGLDYIGVVDPVAPLKPKEVCQRHTYVNLAAKGPQRMRAPHLPSNPSSNGNWRKHNNHQNQDDNGCRLPQLAA